MILAIIIIGFWFHYALGQKYGIPIPTIHDEMAYLLSSDTFTQGHLTNPTHPFWEHFQTFHVFFQPTYQSKYPPAQGFFLAIGQKVFGEPIFGVWINMALSYGAIYWLFLSALSPFHAFLGTLFVVIQPNIATHWGHTYWGGGAALLGGILFFGGIRHSKKMITIGNTILLSLGLFILANSRPFEGCVIFIVSIPVLIGIFIKESAVQGRQKIVKNYVLPLCISGVIIITWILYYNKIITGDPLKYYYSNWDAKTATVDLIKRYKGSPQISVLQKLDRLWQFFIGQYLCLAFIAFPFILRRKEYIFEFLSIIILLSISPFNSKAWPHYLAPVAGIGYLIIYMGFYELLRIKKVKNQNLPRTVFVIIISFYFILTISGTYVLFENGPPRPYVGNLHFKKRIVSKLEMETGKDIVIMHYEKKHSIHEEWVYNRADIDGAEIVWARDLGREKNRRLFEYYNDRIVWALYPDSNPMKLIKMGNASDLK